jgi:hypothetical protein
VPLPQLDEEHPTSADTSIVIRERVMSSTACTSSFRRAWWNLVVVLLLLPLLKPEVDDNIGAYCHITGAASDNHNCIEE